MKSNMKFPKWTENACLMISRGIDGKRSVWSEYTRNPADCLSLRVTVEIAGGSVLFEQFESEEAKEAAYIERSRQAAWRNALHFAEQLWAEKPYFDFVVMFRPNSPNVGPEAICICWKSSI